MRNDIIEVNLDKEKEMTDYDRYLANREKRRLFSKLPRWKRSNLRVRLNNRIRGENLRWGHRLFFTNDYIDPEARCCWCDFYFPSIKDKFTLYSAYIFSCQEKLKDVAEEALKSELDALFAKYIGNTWRLKVTERDAWGNPVTFAELDSDKYTRIWPELDNMSYKDYRNQFITKWLQENKPQVYENYNVDVNDGNYGLFLVMTVDEDLITAEVINRRIEHFYSLGEPVSWTADSPVPEERLIYSTDWHKQKQLSLGNTLISRPRGLE